MVTDVLKAEYQDGKTDAALRMIAASAVSPDQGLNVPAARWHRVALSSILLIGLGLWAIRAFSPSDLADNHQNAPTAYVLDIVYGHHWWCQRDERGAIASKPPLFNWMAALSAKALGTVNHLTLSIPSALATVALAWLIFSVAEEHFGWRAGLLGGACYLLSLYTAKQVLLVRTDAVFSLLVMLSAMAAYGAWNGRSSWFWFWLAAAGATLTKGPVGIPLATSGLLATKWEGKSQAMKSGRGHRPGLVVFLMLTGGWLMAAYLQEGKAVLDKLFVQELFGHAISKGKGNLPLIQFYLSPIYFLSRFAPWSLVTGLALWQVWRFPADIGSERRFERFLFCWFLGGLVLFSVASHQRADLLLPLVPPAAILCGRRLARWSEWVGARSLLTGVWSAAAIFLLAFSVYEWKVRSRSDAVQFTRDCGVMSQDILRRAGPNFPIRYVDASVLFQMHLGTFQPRTPVRVAANLLRQEEPVFLLVHDLPALQRAMGPNAVPIFILTETPPGRFQTRLVSNRRRLE